MYADGSPCEWTDLYCSGCQHNGLALDFPSAAVEGEQAEDRVTAGKILANNKLTQHKVNVRARRAIDLVATRISLLPPPARCASAVLGTPPAKVRRPRLARAGACMLIATHLFYVS